MRLSDIMGAAGLSFYAEVALLIFFAVFVAVIIYVLRAKNRETWDRARHMPLDDEHPQQPRRRGGSTDPLEASSHE